MTSSVLDGILWWSMKRIVSAVHRTKWPATNSGEDWVKLHAAPFDTGYCAVPLKPFRDQTATMRSRILGALIGYYGAGRMPEPGEPRHALWSPSE